MNIVCKKTAIFILLAMAIGVVVTAQTRIRVNSWLTNTDRKALFQQQKQNLVFGKTVANNNLTIEVDEKQTFQSIDGFGFALTGGSAMHIIKMNAASRAALLKELFATDGNNIGISYLRVS